MKSIANTTRGATALAGMAPAETALAAVLLAIAALAIAVLAVAVLAVPDPAFAQYGGADAGWTELSVGIDAEYGLGETEYVFDEIFREGTRTIRIKSLLEFPLDTPLIGPRVALRRYAPGHVWEAGAAVLTNLADPGGTMYDHDWWYEPGGFNGKFSYTESRVEMRSWLVDVQGRLHLDVSDRWALGPLVGFRYQRIAQDVIGFVGWQIDVERPPYRRVEFESPELGIIYRVSYWMAPLGGSIGLAMRPGWDTDLRLALVPLYYSDFDDHVLRFKTAVSDGFGLGFMARLGNRWTIGEGRGLGQPTLELIAEFLTLGGSGDQTQAWYGNDPASEEDDTGTTLTGIPHEVNSMQGRVGLTVLFGF